MTIKQAIKWQMYLIPWTSKEGVTDSSEVVYKHSHTCIHARTYTHTHEHTYYGEGKEQVAWKPAALLVCVVFWFCFHSLVHLQCRTCLVAQMLIRHSICISQEKERKKGKKSKVNKQWWSLKHPYLSPPYPSLYASSELGLLFKGSGGQVFAG